MTDGQNPIKRFIENFGKMPEEEPKELIPHDVRIPVFIGIIAVSLVLLGLLLWLVVIPAIQNQESLSQSAVPALAVPANV